MAKTIIFPSKSLPSIAIILSLFLSTYCEASNVPIGFTVDLIHRDSDPQSPTFNSSLTPSQRLANTLKRSFNRIQHFKKRLSTQSPVADVTIDHDGGVYLMKYAIGTPAFTTFGIADTGSDVSWTQCSPCSHCYKQKSPLFGPKNSSTYKTLPCTSYMCSLSFDYDCDTKKNTCTYSVSYGDHSSTRGDLAIDTLTLGSSEKNNTSTIPNFVFGCGYDNSGTFSEAEPGIIGLGVGKGSLISQLSASIQGKFSYCMIPYSYNAMNSGKMNFGANAKVLGQGVVSTPLRNSTYYYLTLEGISIEDQKLGLFSNTLSSKNGSKEERDMIIDSGTTLTFLPTDLYNLLEEAMKSRIKLPRIDDPMKTLSLCYNTREDIKFPDVVFHFKGGDVNLKPDNVFIRTSNDSLCLAFTQGENPSIFGNIAQGNFLVGYDLVKGTVSFKPNDCSKF